MSGSDLEMMIRPVVESMGLELVGLEHLPQGRRSVLRLYIDVPEDSDREGGVTIDDCGRVSHQVSGVLDVEDPIRGQYALEVSSPGLDRPLFRAADYQRFVGRVAKLRMAVPVEGQRRFEGVIVSADENNVVLELDSGTLSLALADVKQARLVSEL